MAADAEAALHAESSPQYLDSLSDNFTIVEKHQVTTAFLRGKQHHVEW
jgi:hypothetical protein